jgi:hypothetical protein
MSDMPLNPPTLEPQDIMVARILAGGQEGVASLLAIGRFIVQRETATFLQYGDQTDEFGIRRDINAIRFFTAQFNNIESKIMEAVATLLSDSKPTIQPERDSSPLPDGFYQKHPDLAERKYHAL